MEFLNKMETVTTAANVLKADNEKIEFKFDKTNAKAFLIGCSNLFRTDLADLTDAVAASLKDAEGIPEELKELLSGFNKEEFQQKLNEELTEESVQAEAEELEQEIGDLPEVLPHPIGPYRLPAQTRNLREFRKAFRNIV